MITWGTVCRAQKTKLTVGCFVAGQKRLQRYKVQLQPAVSQEREWQPGRGAAESVGGYDRLAWRELDDLWSRDVAGKTGCCRDKACS